MKINNPEIIIENNHDNKRTMDFIISNKQNPKIIDHKKTKIKDKRYIPIDNNYCKINGNSINKHEGEAMPTINFQHKLQIG